MMRLVYLGLLALGLAGWAVIELRRNLGRTLKMALAWSMIFLGLIALYGLWGDLQQGLRPGQSTDATSVTLPRAPDGHYYAQITVQGVQIPFMVDTGASEVVLAPQDARRLGIDPARLVYTGLAFTANGQVRTAWVTLSDLRFGPFDEASLGVSVNETEMDMSLLGMSYLGRFKITMSGDRMVLSR